MVIVGVVSDDRALVRAVCGGVREARGFELGPRPEIVCVDLETPGAFALLRRARAEVIALTASGDGVLVRRALRFGAVDCLAVLFAGERLRWALVAARRRAAVAAGRLSQPEIDALRRGHSGRWLPRGVDQRRLDQMRAALRLRGGPLTAEAAGAAIGIKRTTARRYLEYLVTVGEASAAERALGPGRPTKESETGRTTPAWRATR